MGKLLTMTPAEQFQILTRGAVNLEVKNEFQKKLERSFREQKPLVVKTGFDPTSPDLHLGHSVLLMKMRQFQDLGHRVIFLIGDFTARIGDPSGKNATRPPLTDDEIIANAATYKRQVFKILDPDKTVLQFNSEWLGRMKFDDLIRLAAKYSVARMIEREDFRTRLKKGHSIGMHELLYPLAQGYDSVVLKADVELGGTDQLFNLLVGRDLMQRFGYEPQCILTVPILEGTDAREKNGQIVGDKMSKSLGNYIGLEEDSQMQFGKIMSVCDPLLWRYFELLSLKSTDEIEQLKLGHPKTAKETLAVELVERYHGAQEAQKAKEQFSELFGAGKRAEIPKDAPVIRLLADETGKVIITRALLEAELAQSSSDAKRLIRQGGLMVDGARIDNINFTLKAGSHSVRAGKKRWAQIVVGD